ncbi:MAG TPA: Hsp33 family molecular chaperone HslO [Gammaproteobacteria bacterium]|nr:Hsp33 family molecular chaperone HslO [Gammaproteobacteria bacterium]
MNEVQTFVFEELSIRGAIVRLGETWQQVVAQHHYPEALRRLLGEGIAATVLLATGLKGRPRTSLQLQGEGPVRLLLVQCSSELEVRGMAQWRSERQDEPLLGAGRLAVNLDMGELGQQFQGIVPLVGGSLDACLEAYFAQSEQLPTRLFLNCSEDRVTGMLLQALPAREPDADAFRTITALAATARPEELASLPVAALLERLFRTYTLRLFKPRAVTHDCRCTTEYLAGIVRMLGAAELDALLRETGHVELTCEFCNRSFRYDDADIAAILEGGAPQPPLH